MMSLVAGEGFVELVMVGGFFGILPDFDLMLSPLWRGAHRSVASHSLLASFLAAGGWFVVLRLVIEPWGLMDATGLLLPSILVAFSASFAHAAEDSLTRQGCVLLYPLSRRRLRGPVRYDDVATNTLISLCAVLALLLSASTSGVLV